MHIFFGIAFVFFLFFFNDTATTEIYTLSLHDALPISNTSSSRARPMLICDRRCTPLSTPSRIEPSARSEEHTSELQSRPHLVCRLLLEKKKKRRTNNQQLIYKYILVMYNNTSLR